MRLRYVRDTYYGDWEGLYVDGRLVDQGHEIDWPWVLKKIGVDVTTDEVYVEKIGGRLPDDEDEYLEAVERWQEGGSE